LFRLHHQLSSFGLDTHITLFQPIYSASISLSIILKTSLPAPEDIFSTLSRSNINSSLPLCRIFSAAASIFFFETSFALDKRLVSLSTSFFCSARNVRFFSGISFLLLSTAASIFFSGPFFQFFYL